MFESMPKPASTKVNLDDRRIETEWVLNPDAEGVPSVVVSLTTSHWKSSKQYSTTLTWSTVEPTHEGSAYKVSTWGSDHKTTRVHTSKVARHSALALEAHHEVALAVVADYWENGPVKVFEEAYERNGLGETEE